VAREFFDNGLVGQLNATESSRQGRTKLLLIFCEWYQLMSRQLAFSASFLALLLFATPIAGAIDINSNEVWDGVANPHFADGVMLDSATFTYTIPAGITIGSGATVFANDPLTLPATLNPITWNFLPGVGGLTFADATSTIDVFAGGRNNFPAKTFTLNMSNNAVSGAGRIINGAFVTGGGETGDTMAVAINSSAGVTLGAIDITVKDAVSGAITVVSGGSVNIPKLSNSDVSAGGGTTQSINITGETLALGDIDTRAFRLEGTVGNVNLRALGQPENDAGNGAANNAAVNSITLNGAINTNGPPATAQSGGNLNLTAVKVVLASTFSADLSENGDFTVAAGVTGNGFSEADLFMNASSSNPDALGFSVAHGVPEPTAIALLAIWGGVLGLTRRRRAQ
jgi:hypothetical protein